MGSILAADDSDTLQFAADTFRQSGVLLYPTSTVYGLGGDPLDHAVSERIQTIKQTSPAKPLLVLTDEWERLDGWLVATSELHRRLMVAANDLVITILFEAGPDVPLHLIGNSGHIAVRKTGHPFCRKLIGSVDSVLISTSANRTGSTPPARFRDIEPDILAQSDVAVMGAPCSGLSSTIVAIENGRVVIRREGGVSRESVVARLELIQA